MRDVVDDANAATRSCSDTSAEQPGPPRVTLNIQGLSERQEAQKSRTKTIGSLGEIMKLLGQEDAVSDVSAFGLTPTGTPVSSDRDGSADYREKRQLVVPPAEHSFHHRAQAFQPRLLSPSYPTTAKTSGSTEPEAHPHDAVPTHQLYLQRHRQGTHAPAAHHSRTRSASVGHTPTRNVDVRYTWQPPKQVRIKGMRRDMCTACSVTQWFSLLSTWTHAPADTQDPAAVCSAN